MWFQWGKTVVRIFRESAIILAASALGKVLGSIVRDALQIAGNDTSLSCLCEYLSKYSLRFSHGEGVKGKIVEGRG